MKERLTGAAILVALIVLLVPELLRGPVHPIAHPAAASTGEPPSRIYTIKLKDDAHGATSAAASGPQQPAPIPASAEATTEAPAVDNPPADAAPPKADTPAPKPAPSPAPPEHAPSTQPPAAQPAPTMADTAAAPASGAFLVQLGSFASHDNAERLAKQVRAQGFTVSVARGSTGKHLYKVLVGPAHDHAAAVALEAKLHASGQRSTAIVAK